jgi:hypothetical protein
VSFKLKLLDEPVPDVIPLSSSEKRRKQELERVVEAGLQTFIEVAQALRSLRNERLYRQTHESFENYCRDRFGLGRVAIDQTIRAGSVAQTLIESGCVLPPNVTEAVIRPLTVFEDSDLQSACWQLAESFAPQRGPTTRLVARLCHVVRDCLDNPLDDAPGEPEAKASSRQSSVTGLSKREHEMPFSRPVARLAGWSGFSATIIVAGVEKLESATNLYRSCGILAERCRQVQTTLAANYPELASRD